MKANTLITRKKNNLSLPFFIHYANDTAAVAHAYDDRDTH